MIHLSLQDKEICTGACANGGKCFQQPGAFLCECPAPYTGMKCTEVKVTFSQIISLQSCYLLQNKLERVNKSDNNYTMSADFLRVLPILWQ